MGLLAGRLKALALAVIIGVFALLGTALASTAPQPANADAEFVPIVFVHGFVGSGAQYQSQAMRFASNGYPADHISAFDYNSLDSSPEVMRPLLDAYIDSVRTKFDADCVHIAAHSLGTTVMLDYLNSAPERAARVCKYVNLDGRTADALPGGVPTLAIWGMGDPTRQIVGATNVYLPNQTHTEAVTSPESFAAQYEFLTGHSPTTLDILPEANVELAGRAVNFPLNSGWDGATLEIWEVDGTTGARIGGSPQATYVLGADGAFGPFAADGSKYYEMVLRREYAMDHHFYFQRFIRSNYLIRLLSLPPDSPISAQEEPGPNHATIAILRYKEWWGDDPGGENDILEINGTNVINAATCPISHRPIVIHAFDNNSDGVTDLSAPDEFFFALPFQTGVDIVMPATTPPNGTICLANAPRGDEGHMQVVNVPNWESSHDRISVEFTDYVREGDPPCAPPPTPTATPTPKPTATPGPTPTPHATPSGVGGTVRLPPAGLVADFATSSQGSGPTAGTWAALAVGLSAAFAVIGIGALHFGRR
ncbi:MAG: alpha/beta hydrolase [Dehalococcoidia bacterium]|nr:alpha/beta hydrolase [Dehalococcoidia bacterium]